MSVSAGTADQWKQKQDSRRLRWVAQQDGKSWLATRVISLAWRVAAQAGSIGIRRFVPVDQRDPTPLPPLPRPPQPPVDLGNLGPFGPEFLWGAATAAIQVEGCINGSDWSFFASNDDIRERVINLSAEVGRPYVLEPIGTAVHHGDLEVLKKDLDRAVLLGLNAYRFSIEWSRVMPDGSGTPDPAALQYYSAAVDAMMERGLEPIVTLNHVSLPLWILQPPVATGPPIPIPGIMTLPGTALEDDGYRAARGWDDPGTITHFVAFVNVVIAALDDRVRRWITLNEPVSMAAIAYLGGVWPPGFSLEGDRARNVYFNLLKAHSAAFRAIKAHYIARGLSEPQVGIAHAVIHFSLSSEASSVPASAQDGALRGAIVGAVVGGILGFIFGSVLGPLNVVVAALCAVIGAAIGGAIGLLIGAILGAAYGLRNDPHQKALDQADYFYNFHLLDSLTSGTVDKAIRHEVDRRDLQDAEVFFGMQANTFAQQLDFIGVNYYRNAAVHFNPVLNLRAEFSGGAVLGSDMRRTRDPIPGDNYRNEAHAILSDIGWDMFPDGLHIMLERLNVYGLPIMITENGHAEGVDRNRAPHLLAHLQQLGQAVQLGVDVIGYCHWSLIDNYEWAEGYARNARFGLFEVVRPPGSDTNNPLLDCDRRRPGATFPRRITEGGIALQYFIANNLVSATPFKAAIERFGVMSPDGQKIEPPTRQAGALFEGSIQGPATQPFQLYLSRLDANQWVGMKFDHASTLDWTRLSNISVTTMPNGQLRVSFEHLLLVPNLMPGRPPVQARATYTATTRPRAADGTSTALTGTVQIATLRPTTSAWSAARLETVGLWKTDTGSAGLRFLGIRNWEGEAFSPYLGKFLMKAPSWEPKRIATTWDRLDLSITSVQSFDRALGTMSKLIATRDGDVLRGTLTDSAEDDSPWTATRVREDVEF